MVRILHIIDSFDLGGAQTALLNLVKYADRTRFQHEVATMHGEGIFAQAFRAVGVPVWSLSMRRWPPEYLINLPRLLRRGNFDIVHCHLFGANWIAKPLAALSGIRCIYNHDQCNDVFRTSSPLAIWIDTLTNQLSTRVFAVSRSIENFNLRMESLPSEKVTYLPNSVDLEEFHCVENSVRLEARERFKLPLDAFIIGGVGRLTPQKNFGLLLDASKNSSWVVALFGTGSEESALRTRATKNVYFMGAVADRASIYHALDALVLPSRYEGLPMTVLEAMASGVPVLASAVDGVQEVALNGKNALLAPSENVAAFQKALIRLHADPALRTRLADSARSLVETHFDARKLAAKLEQWYLYDLANTL